MTKVQATQTKRIVGRKLARTYSPKSMGPAGGRSWTFTPPTSLDPGDADQ